MKILEINNKEYKFEFTMEASLHKECVERTTMLLMNTVDITPEGLEDMVSQMADIPQIALSMFHAGLLENHSDEIKSVADAKNLVKVFFKENKDNDNGNWHGLLNLMVECMVDDGFFKQIGLEAMVQNMAQQVERMMKKPQNHKKKPQNYKKKAIKK